MSIKKTVLVVGLVLGNLVSEAHYYQNFTVSEISAVSNIVSTSPAVIEIKQNFIECVQSQDRLLKGKNYFWFSSLSTNWVKWKNFNPNKFTESQVHEIDDAFGAAGVCCFVNYLPRCFTNAVNRTWPSNDTQQAICYKYGRISLTEWMGGYPKVKIFDLEDLVHAFGSEFDYKNGLARMLCFKTWQKHMTDSYLKSVKQYLRRSGKTITIVNGVNPITPYMESFMVALNAPRLNGLNECFASIGKPELKIDLSTIRSAEWAEELKKSILNDEEDLNYPPNRLYLLINLGNDEYNRLVKEYNGGDEQ